MSSSQTVSKIKFFDMLNEKHDEQQSTCKLLRDCKQVTSAEQTK